MTNCLQYPNDWSTLAAEIKELCGWRCSVCGKPCRRPGEPYQGWANELHVAHISQDYHADAVQVACLCAPCHFKHDAPFVWVARRRVERLRQQAAGQLELSFRANK